jgi:hypothetical protein
MTQLHYLQIPLHTSLLRPLHLREWMTGVLSPVQLVLGEIVPVLGASVLPGRASMVPGPSENEGAKSQGRTRSMTYTRRVKGVHPFASGAETLLLISATSTLTHFHTCAGKEKWLDSSMLCS